MPRPSPSATAGASIFASHLVFANLPRKVVEEVLPEGLNLAPRATNPPDHHPVALFFGNHTSTEWDYPWVSLPVGTVYQEFMLLVPFVQLEGGSNWHTFVVRMYLTNAVAVSIGNAVYGFAKALANFGLTTMRLEIKQGANLMVGADFRSFGAWMMDATAENSLPNYQEAKEILSMPLVGRIQLGVGQMICSYFELDFSGAQVRRYDNEHKFSPLTPTMGPGWTVPTPSVPDGAWEIDGIDLRLGFPPHLCVR